MSKVISFSLWGTNRLHCVGALQNVINAHEFLPEWQCRFYLNKSVPDKVAKELESLGAELVWQSPPRSYGYIGLFWRYKVAYDDPDVERFIIRDCDSRVVPHDAACVRAWEDSGQPAHIVRDCESHEIGRAHV